MTSPASNLSAIRTKVRRITGRPSQNQISDAQIDEYINTFYLYDLPEHLRLLDLKTTYEFVTQPNVDSYDFPVNQYISIEPPAYMAGQQMIYYQDRQAFYRVWPAIAQIQTLATGDGGQGPYTASITNVPVLQNSVIISGIAANNVAVTVQDAPTANNNETGTLVDYGGSSVRGTINYLTGAVSLTFPSPIVAGANITAESVGYAAAQPTDVLFYHDKLVLRPVPNIAYKFSIDAYVYPTALDSNDPSGSSPQLNEWWQLLALGAAKKIFEDNANFEQLAQFQPILEEYMALVNRRTLVQLTTQRAQTPYSDQSNYPLGNFYPLV